MTFVWLLLTAALGVCSDAEPLPYDVNPDLSAGIARLQTAQEAAELHSPDNYRSIHGLGGYLSELDSNLRPKRNPPITNPPFSQWGGKRATSEDYMSELDSNLRPKRNPPITNPPFSPWGGKRATSKDYLSELDSNLRPKRRRVFTYPTSSGPCFGKRATRENQAGEVVLPNLQTAQEAAELYSPDDYRSIHGLGGYLSEFDSDLRPKRGPLIINPPFSPWGGKRATSEDYMSELDSNLRPKRNLPITIPPFRPWGGKRATREKQTGKVVLPKRIRFSPWGGKRSGLPVKSNQA